MKNYILATLLFLFAFSCKKDDYKKEIYEEIDFKDLSLNEENSNWDLNTKGRNNFKSGIATFYHIGDDTYGAWYNSGFFYSNRKNFDDIDSIYQKNPFSKSYQYTSAPKKGVNNNVYIVYNLLNNQNDSTNSIEFSEEIMLKKITITNNAYAYCDMKYGSAFSKKFTPNDWFKVILTGFDKNNLEVGEDTFFLAENGIILDYWKDFDFNFDKKVKYLNISFESSDNGAYGMNTPAYFCIGNIKYIK